MKRIIAVFFVSAFTMGRCWYGGVVAFLHLESRIRPIAVKVLPSHFQPKESTSFLYQQSRVFSQQNERNSNESVTEVFPNTRAKLLHEHLSSVGVNADGVLRAALQSIEDPTLGYDSEFGKPAIRTFRAFIYPKNEKDGEKEDPLMLKASAGRTARQVDFLIKRHLSHETEWVRHHDTVRDRRQVFPLILILDNVRSAFNVGSLYRTADAAGCQAVFTCGITPHPHGSGADKVAKSALGAEQVVDTRHFGTTREAIDYLREAEPEYTIIGMETTGQSQIYSNVRYSQKVALILGNEVTGVDTKILSDLDAIVEIPTFGAKNSLNVAACAPVVLYEIIRQWGK
jgi:23S rRNA (guanosine2251-2'-O)-methyltransferase